MTIAALLCVGLLYYSFGLHVAIQGDSIGYLDPAYKLFAPPRDGWLGTRTLGYPLLLTPWLGLPFPALGIAVMQFAFAVLAYLVLAWALRRATLALSDDDAPWANQVIGWWPAVLACTALYGALHALIGSVLTEVTLAVAALLAVVAVQVLVSAPIRTKGRLILLCAVCSLPGAFAMLVKPHWYLAGGVTAAWCSWIAARRVRSFRPGAGAWSALIAASLLAPALVIGAFTIDRKIVAAHGEVAQQLFGQRSTFCNNAHLIFAAVRDDKALRLVDNASADAAVKAYLARRVPASQGGWKMLGFTGDDCTYDAALTEMMARVSSSMDEERRIYTSSLLAAAWNRPLLFAKRVASQMAYGIIAAFDRPAVTMQNDPISAAVVLPAPADMARFFAGTRSSGAAGLLAYSDASIKSGLPRSIARALLVIAFGGLTVLYAVLVGAVLVLGPWLWRAWDAARRRTFMLHLVLPLAVIFAHNALVAAVHTFDIWRYAFNMFFVHLLFIGSAGVFFASEVRRGRVPVPARFRVAKSGGR